MTLEKTIKAKVNDTVRISWSGAPAGQRAKVFGRKDEDEEKEIPEYCVPEASAYGKASMDFFMSGAGTYYISVKSPKGKELAKFQIIVKPFANWLTMPNMKRERRLRIAHEILPEVVPSSFFGEKKDDGTWNIHADEEFKRVKGGNPIEEYQIFKAKTNNTLTTCGSLPPYAIRQIGIDNSPINGLIGVIWAASDAKIVPSAWVDFSGFEKAIAESEKKPPSAGVSIPRTVRTVSPDIKTPQAGDIYITAQPVGNGASMYIAHVGVCVAVEKDGTKWYSGDFGQGSPAQGYQTGKFLIHDSSSKSRFENKQPKSGVHGWLDLDAYPFAIDPPGFYLTLNDDIFASEVKTDIGFPVLVEFYASRNPVARKLHGWEDKGIPGGPKDFVGNFAFKHLDKVKVCKYNIADLVVTDSQQKFYTPTIWKSWESKIDKNGKPTFLLFDKDGNLFIKDGNASVLVVENAKDGSLEENLVHMIEAYTG